MGPYLFTSVLRPREDARRVQVERDAKSMAKQRLNKRNLEPGPRVIVGLTLGPPPASDTNRVFTQNCYLRRMYVVCMYFC